MARISKIDVDAVILAQIEQQLTKTLGKLTEGNASCFIQAFFGPEERMLFAKRLAIIVMLDEQATGYEISKALSVSQATVGKMMERYDRGDYKKLLRLIKKEKANYQELLAVIDSMLTLGLPRYNSKDRWRSLRR